MDIDALLALRGEVDNDQAVGEHSTEEKEDNKVFYIDPGHILKRLVNLLKYKSIVKLECKCRKIPVQWQ